ncbi:MAG: NADH-quinone oxidoreductase subunit C [Gammaproteobacteria bacterium]|nr:NADH-quinone oxidoreductase subunit C [Gammaproteobacteria bacterium]MCP5299343.1 NADH-quinone oxidoreductase subunit C [Chromatiaceae bacterium]
MSTATDLLERFGTNYRISEVNEQKADLTFFKVPKDQAVRLLRELRDDAGYTHLAFLTNIDYIERGIFTLNYMLHNYDTRHTLGMHVDLDRDNAEMESIHNMWAQAATYQRELREMYGIRFPGSPRLDDDFCLEGWDQIPPMRKEFDTAAFSLARFYSRDGRGTEDPREHMKQQLYPTHTDDAPEGGN